MKAMSKVMTDTTLAKNLPQISDDRCEKEPDGMVCNRYLLVVDGELMCPSCDFFATENERLVARETAAYERREKMRALWMFNDKSLINDRLKQSTFENYEPTNENLARAKKLMQRYSANFDLDNPVPVLLKGSYGLGKSHLAAATLKEIAKRGYTSIFISVPKLLTKIKASYDRHSEMTEYELLHALSTVDCLVLDDMGAEQTKIPRDGEVPWSTTKLFEIIDARIGKH